METWLEVFSKWGVKEQVCFTFVAMVGIGILLYLASSAFLKLVHYLVICVRGWPPVASDSRSNASRSEAGSVKHSEQKAS